MAFGDMADAVSGQPASSAEYNKIVDHVDELDTRLDAAETTVAALNTRTTNASTGNAALGTRATELEAEADGLSARVAALEASGGGGTKPICILTVSTSHQPAGSYTSGKTGTVRWDTVLADPDGMWSSTTPEKITIQTPGFYRVTGSVFIGSQANTIDLPSTATNLSCHVTSLPAQADNTLGPAVIYDQYGFKKDSVVPPTPVKTALVRRFVAGDTLYLTPYCDSSGKPYYSAFRGLTHIEVEFVAPIPA